MTEELPTEQEDVELDPDLQEYIECVWVIHQELMEKKKEGKCDDTT